MPEDPIRIEPLTTTAQFLDCEALQREIWGMEETDVVPLHLLTTMQRNGGLVLGAFEKERMVGFLMGFLGIDPADAGRLKHCSHMMGIARAWRGQGIGYRLKLAQREHALAQGLNLVTWTYDPLESANAALNIGKLGAVARSYIREVYGELRDELNAGLPTDRLLVEWEIAADRVAKRLAPQGGLLSPQDLPADSAQPVNPGAKMISGMLHPPEGWIAPEDDLAAVEIPAAFQAIKERDPDLAMRWRLHTRALFEHCFAAGFEVRGFVSERTADERRSHYVLYRRESDL
ncbi:MAG: GNAT family N-acetyltransferase [Candidatus Bipolaricaulota bacterium]|nr:MAG: GNAT family N-acetyltransferase [Candidatus Bipolaricaulota bacterium]